MPLHPSQLYEMLTEGALFVFLYWRYGRPHRDGNILGLFLLLSSTMRFLIEFTRFHEQALPFGLPLSITQWIAIFLALAGAARPLGRTRATPTPSPTLHTAWITRSTFARPCVRSATDTRFQEWFQGPNSVVSSQKLSVPF